VHDLVSEAPVVADAPALDGGLQSMADLHLARDTDGDEAHSFLVCEPAPPPVADTPADVDSSSAAPANHQHGGQAAMDE
tara:strand:- start:1790 stop:2026 length:237 start_codon:yes stop_codon:yes gene_type:complete